MNRELKIAEQKSKNSSSIRGKIFVELGVLRRRIIFIVLMPFITFTKTFIWGVEKLRE